MNVRVVRIRDRKRRIRDDSELATTSKAPSSSVSPWLVSLEDVSSHTATHARLQ